MLTQRPPSSVQVIGSLTWPGQADAEHDAVDDGGAVREVLDRRERDLGPERDRAHHLPARA